MRDQVFGVLFVVAMFSASAVTFGLWLAIVLATLDAFR